MSIAKTRKLEQFLKWIPCSERLPESDEPEILCLVTYQNYNVSEGKWKRRKVGVMSYLTKHQTWNTKAMINVPAWLPLLKKRIIVLFPKISATVYLPLIQS